MANLPRRKTYGSVNLAFLEPVERLDPDQLKKFSKEELSAYLLYYDIDISKNETKPELKRQLRNLITQIKTGQVARRDGIGSDIKLPTLPQGQPATRSTDPQMIPRGPQPILHSSTASHSAQQARAGASTSSKAPTGQHSAASSLNLRPTGQETSWKSSLHASDPSGPGRPPILDAGLVSNVQDFVAPVSLERLTQTYPTLLTRMSSYYDSLVSRNEHLYTPSKEFVARSSEPSHAHYSSENSCTTCGKRSSRDCRFRRCRSCCNMAQVRCQVHSIGLVLQAGQELRDWPSSHLNAQATSTSTPPAPVPKQVRPSAPSAPKPTMLMLGDRESTEPWLELREEALYRAQQNNSCMETIFDLQSTSSIQNWLGEWQPKSPQALESQALQAQSQIQTIQEHHNTTLSKWTQKAERFSSLMKQIEDSAGDSEAMTSLRSQFSEELGGQIAVPLTTRKRSPPDGELPNQPPTKVKAN